MSRLRFSLFSIVGGALVLSSSVAMLSTRRGELRESLTLLRLAPPMRRAVTFAELFEVIREIERKSRPNEIVPVVMRRPRDVDCGVFLTYYLYPRTTKYYWSLDQYRVEAHRPADALIAYADLTRAAVARLMTYAQIRDEQVRETAALREPVSETVLRYGIVPFVAAFDGAPPDAYTTQADFLPVHDGVLHLALQPSGKTVTIPLRRGQQLTLRDLVYEQFGELGVGWLCFEITTPAHVSVWLINRGRLRQVEIPVYESVPKLPSRLGYCDRLWLLNPNDSARTVFANGKAVSLSPRCLVALPPSQSENSFAGASDVIAFGSEKLADGNTRFTWPAHP